MNGMCITIPVYNEELRLEDGVRKLWEFTEHHQISARIDIADNGSVDRTREVARRLCAELSRVSLTEVPEKGVGLALQTSWNAAPEPIVGYMDVDLSTRLEHLLQVIEILTNRPQIHVVNGSRLRPGSKVIGRPLIREVTSRGLNFLLRAVLHTRITDGMCGFKFIRRAQYLELVRDGLKRKDWFFNAELLVRSEWLGFNIEEIPVEWHDSPSSNVNISRLSRSYWASILELRREYGRRQH